MAKKSLVAYFSATGTTENVAKLVAKAANADLFEIKPAVPYTAKDLYWTDKHSRSTVEMADKNSRPEMAEKLLNAADYDVVFVGFPIWWYVAPTIVNTFLESADFSGKTIVPFATSGGSSFGETVNLLKKSVPANVRFLPAKLLNGRPTEKSVSEWIETLNLD
ncbi:MAG TPA: flavodoxin [Clostridiales bacterium]|nr:flavodoxin [Clostridiales bacterium]